MARKRPVRPKCHACGKLRYPTWDAAVSWILSMTRAGAPPLTIYQCRKGGTGFHVSRRRDWSW